MAGSINIEEHLNIVDMVIIKLNIPQYLQEDAKSEGMVALTIAADKFDSTRQVPFPAWANLCIKRHICKFLIKEYKYNYRVNLVKHQLKKRAYYLQPINPFDYINTNKEKEVLMQAMYGFSPASMGRIHGTSGKYESLILRNIKKQIKEDIK